MKRLAALAILLAGCGGGGSPTPAGYWEGSARASETPMKDHVRNLTRTVDATFWFNVAWDAERGIGTVSGEAEGKYDAELKVENLPKVSVPAPGGTVKFEPSVGGKLTDPDNKRRFPIVGVLRLDGGGGGTLVLQKVASPGNPDKPMEFTMRADPGVSGTVAGPAGSVTVHSSGSVSAESFGAEAKAGPGSNVIVKKMPMAPFSPFTSAAARVEKRPNGPYVAAFEDRGEKHAFTWTAKQSGGERREAPAITPDARRQLEEMVRRLGTR
jgi:hypothetical protein